MEKKHYESPMMDVICFRPEEVLTGDNLASQPSTWDSQTVEGPGEM